MKKLTLTLIASVFAVVVYGQSLSLSKTSEIVSGPLYDEIVTHLTVTNTTNTALQIKVRRTKETSFTGNSTWFCWDLCFDTVPNASGIVTIPANGSSDLFSHHVQADVSGTTKVIYNFYDVNNMADSSVYVVTTNVGATGINDMAAVKFSNPYPNPANDNVTFNYSLPNAYRATLKMYNMLGALVKTTTTTDPSGKLTINTSEFRPGLYLYDLQVGGKSMKTGKFTVTQ